MKNKAVSGFFWKFGEQISSQLVTFVLSIVLARLLTPKDYGVVALVNIFITIANVFVTSGFGTALVQKKSPNETDFSTVFYMSEGMSFLAYLVIFFIAPFVAKFYNNSELIPILRVFALTLPLSAFNGIQQAYISKHLMFKKVFISTTVSAILSGIIGVVMAYLGFGVWALVGQSLSNVIIVSIVLFSEIKWYPKNKFSWEAGKPLLSFGWKMLATDLLATFFNQLRSLLLGKTYTTSELAYYNRGLRFPELISDNVNGTVSSVLFPVLANYGDDHVKIKEGLRRAIKASTFILMPLLFGMMGTTKQIVLLLLTEKWVRVIPYMQILCMSCIFDSVSNENMQALKAIGRSDSLLKLEFVKKPLYLILLLIGMRISVYALAVTQVIYNILAVWINMAPNRKFLNYTFKEQLEDMIPALLNSIIMFEIVYGIGNILKTSLLLTFIIQVLVGMAVYLIIAVVFKMSALKDVLGMLKRD